MKVINRTKYYIGLGLFLSAGIAQRAVVKAEMELKNLFGKELSKFVEELSDNVYDTMFPVSKDVYDKCLSETGVDVDWNDEKSDTLEE